MSVEPVNPKPPSIHGGEFRPAPSWTLIWLRGASPYWHCGVPHHLANVDAHRFLRRRSVTSASSRPWLTAVAIRMDLTRMQAPSHQALWRGNLQRPGQAGSAAHSLRPTSKRTLSGSVQSLPASGGVVP